MNPFRAFRHALYLKASQYIARATLVEGTIKDSDQLFRCLFIDNSKLTEYLLPKIYSGEPRILRRSRVWFFSLRRLIQHSRESLDMCIAVVPLRYDAHFNEMYDFRSQEWVQQILDVSANAERLGSPSKNKLHGTKRKIKKFGFSYRVSHDRQDLFRFYHNMYLPLIRKNFGNWASVDSFEEMEEYFARGFLLLVTQEGQDVAGVLCWQRDDALIYRRAGVLNGDDLCIQQGGQSAAYYFMIEEARRKNIKKLDLMLSRPLRYDGVYRHKRDWGAAVFPNDESKSWVYFFNLGSPKKVALFFERNPIIATTKTGLKGIVGVKNGCELSPELENELTKEFFSPGLEGLIVLTPNQTAPLHIDFNKNQSGG